MELNFLKQIMNEKQKLVAKKRPDPQQYSQNQSVMKQPQLSITYNKNKQTSQNNATKMHVEVICVEC